jgi:GNAT superfamily N-acetyltransferase
VVADAWQRRGVGAALMRALIARAQARGVTALAMDVLPGNRRVLAMILGHWPDAAVGHSPDGIDIHITLSPARPRETAQPRETAPPLDAAGKHVRSLVPMGG